MVLDRSLLAGGSPTARETVARTSGRGFGIDSDVECGRMCIVSRKNKDFYLVAAILLCAKRLLVI